MTDNPYAAPKSTPPQNLTFNPLPARKIRVVVRIFRLLGWVGLVYFTSCSIILLVTAISRFANDEENAVYLLQLSGGSCAIGMLASAYLLVAQGLVHKNPKSGSRAKLLATLLLPGMPFFTIAGILCLINLVRYYDAYRNLPETPRVQ